MGGVKRRWIMPWAPRDGETWRKDRTRTRERATRLRAEQTPSEKALWRLLRDLKHDGAHLRRQCPPGDHVFDFACLALRLLIELDGGVHVWLDVQLRDARKTQAAEQAGFRVLRFTNDQLRMAPAAVMTRIRAALQAPHPCPSPKGEG